MRKIFPVIVILSTVLFLGGCARYDDMIPETLGEPEGLWLYRGAERMRTDGSEKELLFNEIELDGEMLTAEEYTVKDYLYCTETSTAFYVLTVKDADYLYRYDYAEKYGEQLSGGVERGRLNASESYVCFEYYENAKSLYYRNGALACEGMEGYNFTEDILWKYVWQEDGEELVWWRAAASHSAVLPRCEGGLNIHYDGKYLYHLNELSGCFSVDAETEEVKKLSYDGTFYEYKSVGKNGWFLTYGTRTGSSYPNRAGDDIYSDCKLYACVSGEAQLLYTFSETWDVEFAYSGSREGMIALLKETRRVETDVYDYTYEMSRYESYYYDLAKGKLKKGSVPAIKSEPEELICGEYTFWVGSKHYGFVMWLGGECYYLYRSSEGKKEIMQYAFDLEWRHTYNEKFYDDICEF